jgi:hypothetical protein
MIDAIDQTRAQSLLLNTWIDRLGITIPVDLEIGEIEDGVESAWGRTFGPADNSAAIVIIDPRCPADRFEHILVHELVHVAANSHEKLHTEEDRMEWLTDQVAILVQKVYAENG